jgi:hypothetical protein
VAVAAPGQALAAQASAPAAADQAAKLGEANAIIAVIFPASQRQQMFAKLQANLVEQMGAMMPAAMMSDPGLRAIIDQFKTDAFERQRAIMMKHLPIQIQAMATAYAREFSLGELREIHAFAATPAGSHYLSQSLAIIGDPAVAKANSETIAEMQAATQELIPGFKDKAIAYLKAHPDVAAKIDAADKK